MKGTILKLRNGKDYYVFEELTHNNKKYALATECNLEKDEVNEEELVVMEVKLINDELVVDEIYDDNEAMEVVALLRDKIQNNN